MSTTLPIGILQHHFASFDPSEAKCLAESIAHFHLRDLEASDYRSAYHQFSDWLYGWSVSDETEQVHGGKRPPRDIRIEFEREKQDAQRIMKTFETLVSLSLRQLKVCYSDIETEMPRLGQGLDTFSNIHRVDEEELQIDLSTNATKVLEKIWGNKFVEEALKQDTSAEGSNPEEARDSKSSLKDLSAVSARQSRISFGSRKSETGLYESQHSMGEEQEVKSGRASFSFLGNSVEPEKKDQSGAATPDEEPLPVTETTAIPEFDAAEEPLKALQRDVNHVFREVDQSTEYTLLTMCSIAAILAFAELLGDKEMFSKALTWAHDLSKDFISNTLKTVWDLFNREIPHKTTLSALRNPTELKGLLQYLIAQRAVNGVPPKLRMRKLHQKFATLHLFFTLVDIHIFPNFYPVHKEGIVVCLTQGLKCAQYSAFDSYLWLTGGYDCIIRITDIRASNKHMCLAQYVGHKSIVTDVKFTHDDSHIVSCSYDRSIKIWNSRTAVAEKTLMGHTDAVTSCDVTPDGRYIVSGSLDNTIRFWDFGSGECITVIKKHTRWVKIVRFSPDGRYLATAGMDRKVYIWETKILANSRSPSHSRLFDNFNDYVLDLVLFKPSLLLTSSRDSMIRLFDYLNGHELQSVSLSPSWACTLSLSSNGEYFATGSFDNNINIFRTKDFVRVREIRAFNLGILCVRFPTDLGYVFVGTSEGFMQQIDL
ncbi:pre-mRNA-processing factor 17 [Kappamyces sp. JEL0829]|nr:pre-mRNA-processing factor 17 [Kappamyces sp. JEL0829]